ncbi:NAD-capped RNA hydrolase Npy1p [[Candida] railenensis]|uniref:NAD(+) diphosphatase n=1 Tax=[Candida] railenensis TaxID=45579 RepID=A0A9P0W1G1_9ASCO|nr:NAD-capped RNA hydrolase Npy1p [[Candida] railenensis]
MYFSRHFVTSAKLFQQVNNHLNKSKIYASAMSHSVNTSVTDQQNDMYFGTEAINRVSFLREDTEFICNSIKHPAARFIAFSKTNPLINKSLKEKLLVFTNGDNQIGSKKGLATSSDGRIVENTWTTAVHNWCEDNRNESADLRSHGKPVFLFLGLEDESVGLKLSDLKAEELEQEHSDIPCDEKYLDHQGRYQGIPYFAVDVTASPEIEEFLLAQGQLQGGSPTGEGTGDDSPVFFTRSRKHYLGFTHKEAALYSHGKMFLDWLSRNLFCPGCGTKTIPIHAGGKLKCTNTKTTIKRDQEVSICPVKSASVSNVSFPRTDACVITAITSSDRSKILLSLSKRHAVTKMYACTAGFMEPSETVEVATKREIWEETGVVCNKINIIMTQPWPFPGNLMIGCLAVVDFNGENEVIHLDNDKELADARWFDTELIRKWIYENNNIDNPEGILLPNPESIAFSLIKMAVDQRQQKL